MLKLTESISCGNLRLPILLPPFKRADFKKVISRQKPTVSKADLELQERVTKEFGGEGWLLSWNTIIYNQQRGEQFNKLPLVIY